MNDKPEAVAGDITSHICYSRFSKKPSHRHHWKRDTLQPDCERCGTLIDREHNEVGPLQWGRAVEPAALPTPAQPDASALVEALQEAVDVFAGMCDDEIDEELLPRLRAALTAWEAQHG